MDPATATAAEAAAAPPGADAVETPPSPGVDVAVAGCGGPPAGTARVEVDDAAPGASLPPAGASVDASPASSSESGPNMPPITESPSSSSTTPCPAPADPPPAPTSSWPLPLLPPAVTPPPSGFEPPPAPTPSPSRGSPPSDTDPYFAPPSAADGASSTWGPSDTPVPAAASPEEVIVGVLGAGPPCDFAIKSVAVLGGNAPLAPSCCAPGAGCPLIEPWSPLGSPVAATGADGAPLGSAPSEGAGTAPAPNGGAMCDDGTPSPAPSIFLNSHTHTLCIPYPVRQAKRWPHELHSAWSRGEMVRDQNTRQPHGGERRAATPPIHAFTAVMNGGPAAHTLH